MLIGLCGAAGAGKNTVAGLLVDADGQPFLQVAFADPLYQCVSLITGMPVEQLQDRSLKEQPIGWLDGKSPRQLLQSLGTEWGRELVCREIWVRSTMERIRGESRSVVITDVRFDNEAEAIVQAGGQVWRVVRGGPSCLDAAAAAHASEAGVSDYFVARIIANDGTLDDLKDAVASAKM
jgi:hypothetical protein